MEVPVLAIIRPAVSRLRPLLLSAAGVGLAVLAACELPKAPEWDIRVMAPFSSDPMSIVDFLPALITADSLDGQAVFRVEAQQQDTAYSLGEMCPACLALAGQTVAVPTFEYTDSLVVPFSDTDLVSVEILSAALTLRVRNNLNFDPLRPTADPPGYVALAVRDLASGALIDSLLISGASEPLPAGDTLEYVLDIGPAQLTDGFRVWFHASSPDDGQTVQIDNNLSVVLDAALDEIVAAAVTVLVDGDTLDERFTAEVDQDFRQELAERVDSATYELVLVHNVEVDGTLEVSIAGSEVDLFSDMPDREVRLRGLVFTAGVPQYGELNKEQIECIERFPNPDSVYVGYRGVASGTRTDFGRPNLSRLTPDLTLDTELTVTSKIRVGG
ncbi:MAG: hypothetical protein AMS25_04540 [Gemmatimonas sp. SM23_52]|nr:MAG: hypothetical protein AMS25_04540 [Gemmatimonas sp. SM23_52]